MHPLSYCWTNKHSLIPSALQNIQISPKRLLNSSALLKIWQKVPLELKINLLWNQIGWMFNPHFVLNYGLFRRWQRTKNLNTVWIQRFFFETKENYRWIFSCLRILQPRTLFHMIKDWYQTDQLIAWYSAIRKSLSDEWSIISEPVRCTRWGGISRSLLNINNFDYKR